LPPIVNFIPLPLILRRKRALCNLLRFKNSLFRQKLHTKIRRLERLGRKDEIHRLLKAINDHDESMQSGDGPCQLFEEILGQQTVDDEIEVLDSLAIAAMQGRDVKRVKNEKDLVESNASTGSTKGDNVCDIENKASTDLGEISHRESNDISTSREEVKQSKNRDSLLFPKMEANANTGSKNSRSEMHQELIDICEDEDLDQVPTISQLDQKPAYQRKAVLHERVSEETTVGSSAVSPVTSDSANRKANDHKQMPTDDISSNLSFTDDSREIEMGRGAVDCNAEDFDRAELDQKPSHMRKCVNEETTTGSSLASSSANDNVDRSANDQKQMRKDDIPINVSSNNATLDLDCIDLSQELESIEDNNYDLMNDAVQQQQLEVIDLSQEEDAIQQQQLVIDLSQEE